MSGFGRRLRITGWMRTEMLVTLGFVLTLSCLSGLADARGFLHASRMWRADGLVWFEFARSAAAFALGMGMYWLCARFMQRLGIAAAEVQTMIWFTATIIGIAVASGRFGGWPVADQLVAVTVVLGVAWLLVRQAATS
jgi:hypothetical protein